MADFRAEMHRRKHGEQHGPKQQKPAPPPPEPKPYRSAPAPKRRKTRRRETWEEVKRDIAYRASVRIGELGKRNPMDTMPCPWGAIFDGECLASCKCRYGGTPGTVTVGFMLAHYRRVYAEYRQ